MDFQQLLQPSFEYEWRTIWSNGQTPSIRLNTAACVHASHFWLVCGAGAGVGRCSELWQFSLASHTWTLIPCRGDAPPRRDGHSISYIGDGKFLLFGGQGNPVPNLKADRTGDAVKSKTFLVREVFNDLYMLDCNTKTWTRVDVEGSVFPPPRRGHSSIFIGSKTKKKPTSKGPTSQQQQDKTSKEPEGIPERSLLIFAGSGIEASKHTELIYNDLWVYSLDSNRWSRYYARGVYARPMFDHRVELIDDNMIVVGGILGPAKSSLHHIHDSADSSLLVLNIKSLLWSSVDIFDRVGRPAKLQLHGHSLVADPLKPGLIYIFGGKDCVDGKLAAIDHSQSISNNPSKMGSGRSSGRNSISKSHVLLLDINACTVSPIRATNMTPDNRYGHAGVSCTAVEDLLQIQADRFANQKKKKPVRTVESSLAEESVMYLFGGTYIDRAGFAEPIIYQLVKVVLSDDVRTVGSGEGRNLTTGGTIPGPANGGGEDDLSVSKPPSPTGVLVSPLGMGDESKSPRSQASINHQIPPINSHSSTISFGTVGASGGGGGGGGDAMSTFSDDENDAVEDELSEVDRVPTIWEKMLIQQQQQVGGGGSLMSGSKEVVKKDPSCWNELKLALSHSLTERSSIHSLSAPSATKGGTLFQPSQTSSRLGGKNGSRGFSSSLSRVGNASIGGHRGGHRGGVDAGFSALTMEADSEEGYHSSSSQHGQFSSSNTSPWDALSALSATNPSLSKLPPKERAAVQIKFLSQQIKPLVAGKSRVEARLEYQRLFPPLPMDFGKGQYEFNLPRNTTSSFPSIFSHSSPLEFQSSLGGSLSTRSGFQTSTYRDGSSHK